MSMDREKIRKALTAASGLMVLEVWKPPVSDADHEERFNARSAVQKMCIEALHELARDPGQQAQTEG
jgi:hypothetical protein